MPFDNLPSFSGNRERLSRSEYFKYGGSGLLLIGLVVLYVFEFTWFGRMLGLRPLIIGALLVGAIIGMLVGHRFQSSAKDLTERIQIYLFFTLIIMLFMPLVASLSNRLLSFHETRTVPVEFVEEQAYLSSPYGIIQGEKIEASGYYVFFYRDQELYRIKTPRPLFPAAARGDTVQLPMRRGLWGVEFVPL